MESTTSPEFPITSSLPRSLAMHLKLGLSLDLGQVRVEKADAFFRQHTTSDPVAASLIAAQPARFEQVR